MRSPSFFSRTWARIHIQLYCKAMRCLVELGNNTGACGVRRDLLLYATVTESPVQLSWCLWTLRYLRREKLVYHTQYYLHYYYSYTHTHTVTSCYFVCTHNRIRSPRLAAFGRIEIRWVREVGKFGPYLRYKDWLRR